MENKFSPEDKVAVVTGATGTFGTEFCRTFAANGADIVAAVRPKEKGGTPRGASLFGWATYTVTVATARPPRAPAAASAASRLSKKPRTVGPLPLIRTERAPRAERRS